MSTQTSSKVTKLCSIAVASYIAYKWYNNCNCIEAVKPVIAVDLDEVLCQFIELMLRYVNDNKIFGDKQYKVSDFNSYLFHDVWGGAQEETTKIVQDFLSSKYFTNINEMKSIENAYQVLSELKSKYKFVICTSRQLRTKEITYKWVNKYFPNIFDEIVFGNHFGLKGRKISKPQLCKELNARILIDDSSYYAKQAHISLDYVLLFDWNGQYNWNKTKKQIAPNVKRVYNWNEIKKFLEKYYQQEIQH